MTVELDRDDLVNLIIGCSGPYYTIMDKYNESRWRIKRQQNIILQMKV